MLSDWQVWVKNWQDTNIYINSVFKVWKPILIFCKISQNGSRGSSFDGNYTQTQTRKITKKKNGIKIKFEREKISEYRRVMIYNIHDLSTLFQYEMFLSFFFFILIFCFQQKFLKFFKKKIYKTCIDKLTSLIGIGLIFNGFCGFPLRWSTKTYT